MSATPALCGNPDCGAFFDRSPVPHRDREEGVVVILCQECTVFFARSPQSRYERLELSDPTITTQKGTPRCLPPTK